MVLYIGKQSNFSRYLIHNISTKHNPMQNSILNQTWLLRQPVISKLHMSPFSLSLEIAISHLSSHQYYQNKTKPIAEFDFGPNLIPEAAYYLKILPLEMSSFWSAAAHWWHNATFWRHNVSLWQHNFRYPSGKGAKIQHFILVLPPVTSAQGLTQHRIQFWTQIWLLRQPAISKF